MQPPTYNVISKSVLYFRAMFTQSDTPPISFVPGVKGPGDEAIGIYILANNVPSSTGNFFFIAIMHGWDA